MSLPRRPCDHCKLPFTPSRRTQRFCDAVCSYAGHIDETRAKRQARRAADPAKLLAAYRRRATAIKRWIKDVGECPCCGWSGNPYHYDRCPLAPVE